MKRILLLKILYYLFFAAIIFIVLIVFIDIIDLPFYEQHMSSFFHKIMNILDF
ncbi:MAG: hypothetical protein K8S14_10130 [Actinomycetia bacterium]|nr:hypothetical protein [Actinomycetes bacterium]